MNALTLKSRQHCATSVEPRLVSGPYWFANTIDMGEKMS